jgi:hypothetical protein
MQIPSKQSSRHRSRLFSRPGRRAASPLQHSVSLLRHYAVISTGLLSMALGMAVIVSFLSVAYADNEPARELQLSSVSYSNQVSSVVSEGMSSRFEMAIPVAAAAAVASPPKNSGQGAPNIDQVVVTGTIKNVNLTFYDCLSQGFCGNMANGKKVYEGAAACSYNLVMGTRFIIVGDPTGRVYVCGDRGLLANTWIDVFWYNPADGWRWQAAVGRFGTIQIVSVP